VIAAFSRGSSAPRRLAVQISSMFCPRRPFPGVIAGGTIGDRRIEAMRRLVIAISSLLAACGSHPATPDDGSGDLGAPESTDGSVATPPSPRPDAAVQPPASPDVGASADAGGLAPPVGVASLAARKPAIDVAGAGPREITWFDNDGLERGMTLENDGTSGQMYYYASAAERVDVVAGPNGGAPFGGTVHHAYMPNGVTQPSGRSTQGTVAVVFQGDHHLILEEVQTFSMNGVSAPETTMLFFQSGVDYFQTSYTIQGVPGSSNDSRYPYSGLAWDGSGQWTPLEGQEYSSHKYFKQPSYNGDWTWGGDAKKDICYVWEWDHDREFGYVQTQTYEQQPCGSLEQASNLDAVTDRTQVPTSGNNWQHAYQMNFFDGMRKMTWGTSYYFTSGDSKTGAPNTTKNGWGQYSLSVVLDTKSEGGVTRLRNENLAIQSGKVSLTASVGQVAVEGPVGYANPNLQALSPAGFDHVFRVWLVRADGGRAAFALDAAAPIANPTFRVIGLGHAPRVQIDGAAATADVDYFASLDTARSEVWLTLLKTLSGTVALSLE
jgi:hypothetical protein